MATLNEAFGLREGDLELNRRGALSERQTTELRRATGEDAGFMIGMAIALAVVMYAVLVVLILDGRFFGRGELVAQGAVVLVAGVLPTAGIVWAVRAALVHRKTRPMCETIEGVATRRTQRHGALVLHEIVVGDRRFGITERAYDALADGARYRVYVVPKANVVISIEPTEA